MVNFGWNSASILGIFLAVAGAGLYFLRSFRPELSRDYDIFFAAVGLACGGILLFNGWRLDPILQFGQFLLALSTAFFAFETIRLRALATEQAKRTTRTIDDERPVSRTYQAYREPEYDEIEPYQEARYNPRQLRGYQEERTSRRGEYEEESRRTSRKTRRVEETPQAEQPIDSRKKRSPRGSSRRPSRYDARYDEAYPENYPDRRGLDQYDEWEDGGERPEERPPYKGRPSVARDSRMRDEGRGARKPASRSSRSRSNMYQDEEPAPYVDYIDYSADESSNDLERDDFERDDFERGNFERGNFEKDDFERGNFERDNFEKDDFERDVDEFMNRDYFEDEDAAERSEDIEAREGRDRPPARRSSERRERSGNSGNFDY